MNRILIADDEPHVLRVLKMSLEREGYSVDVCDNGRDALEVVLRDPPEVLITDINMEGNEELEFLGEVRQQAPEIPVIVVTGYPSFQTAVEALIKASPERHAACIGRHRPSSAAQ